MWVFFSAKHIQHKQVHTGCHTEYFVLGFTQQTELKFKDLRIVVALKMAKAPLVHTMTNNPFTYLVQYTFSKNVF